MTVTAGAFDSFGIPQGLPKRLDDLEDVDTVEVEEGDTIVHRGGRWVPGDGNEVAVQPTQPEDIGVELWVNPYEADPPPPLDQATADAKYVSLEGDAMSGELSISVTGAGGGGVAPNLRLERDTAPELHFYKRSQTAGQRKWKVYISGPANETGTTPASLSFAALSDDELTNVATLRMYRDGRLLLGADGQSGKEAVTFQQMYQAGTMTYSTGWGAYAAGVDTYVVKTGPSLVNVHGLLRRSGNLAMTAGGLYRLGTIPAGYRPTWDGVQVWAIHQHDSNTEGAGAHAYLEPNGALWLVPHYAGTILTGQWVTVNGSWFV